MNIRNDVYWAPSRSSGGCVMVEGHKETWFTDGAVHGQCGKVEQCAGRDNCSRARKTSLPFSFVAHFLLGNLEKDV